MQGEEGEETTRGIAKSRLLRNVVALGSRPVVFSVLLKFSSVQVPPSLGRPGATTKWKSFGTSTHFFIERELGVRRKGSRELAPKKKMVCLSLPHAIAQYMKRIGQS